MNEFHSGFITIIGCPNVGKSTLLNALVGQKIAIVTDRAQTTRNKITGVYSAEGLQMVFLDTPGVTNPRNRLGDYMRKVAMDALDEVEAVLFVADAVMGIRERDEALMDRLKKARAPVVALMNKADCASMEQMRLCRETLQAREQFAAILSVSAKTGMGLEELISTLAPLMPAGPRYFPEDMVTDQPERVICGELIREQALLLLKEEVPHGVGVGIDKMERRTDRDLMDVYATIYCERDSHKGIIIGKGGAMLKRIGAASRKEIEWLLGCPVNLQLWVKVKEDWRNKPAVLHELGYE
jgi:GTP-binding protein Era